MVDRSLDLVASVFLALAAILLATMVCINLINIVARGAFGHAFGWVFNWTLLMFVWMLLFGFFVYMRRNRDVVVDVVVSRLPRNLQIAVAIGADLVGILVALALLRAAPGLLAMQTSNMDAIDLPIYTRSVPIFVSSIFLLAHFANHIASLLNGSARPFERYGHTADREGAPE